MTTEKLKELFQARLYSVADKATNQVVSPYPMNPYSIHEWMTEYTAQA